MTKRNFPFQYRRAEGVKVDLYTLRRFFMWQRWNTYTTMIARIITTSVRLVIFCMVFLLYSFQNRFTFIKIQDIKSVFLQKKTRNQSKRSRHDAIVDMHSDMIPYLHEFNDEVSLFWQIPFQLEINCKRDVNETTIALDCVAICLIKDRWLAVIRLLSCTF